MDSKPALVLLGFVTLFLGGVVGGVLGSALLGRGAAQPAPITAVPGTGPAIVDTELARALQELSDEVRRMRSTSPAPDAGERRPVTEEGEAPALDEERIVTALERLTLALQAAQGRAAPGGIGITPLVLPAPGSRQGALLELVGRDWEENSKEYRFWTFQQVLDRFGRPDEVSDDRWLYRIETREGEEFFSFQFSQGYLMNIYD